MKLTTEQSAELTKTKWNKVGLKDDECVRVVLYADEMNMEAWESVCELTRHDITDSMIELLIIGEK
jgi:hypothetical protein